MAASESTTSTLPRPFYDRPWPAALRPHARALWAWHLALHEARAPALDGDDLTAYFEAQRARAAGGEPVDVVPPPVAEAAYAACRAHRLPADLLAVQVMGARQLQGGARFATAADVQAFLDVWARPHGRLLAHLAGASGSWQVPLVDELTTGFFWIGRLAGLPRDLERDWLFIPEEDLDRAGVGVEQLRAGAVDEGVRRLLWKQMIRAQDAFAHGDELVRELPRRYAGALKRYWFGGLEVLGEIRRRQFDVWSKPVALTLRHRLQVHFQSRFGRTTFRS